MIEVGDDSKAHSMVRDGGSMCGDVESAVDDREDWNLVIFSVKKDANLSAREDIGGEGGRILKVCDVEWY